MFNLGLSGFTLGTIAQVWATKRGFYSRSWFLREGVATIRDDRAVLLGAILAGAGVLFLAAVLFDFLRGGFGPGGRIREMVMGTTLVLAGIQIIFASFVVSLIDDEMPPRN
jgi:hypothetical protein